MAEGGCGDAGRFLRGCCPAAAAVEVVVVADLAISPGAAAGAAGAAATAGAAGAAVAVEVAERVRRRISAAERSALGRGIPLLLLLPPKRPMRPMRPKRPFAACPG
jgi:hypothetical protein